MYTEKLVTPHPATASEQRQQQTLAQSIETIPHLSNEAAQAEIVECAEQVAQTVSETLAYQSFADKSRTLSPEQLATDQISNCYGFTVVASECLESVGVPHWIGYVNDHACCIVTDEKRSFAWFMSAVSPRMNTMLDATIYTEELQTADQSIEQYGRAVIKFKSHEFIDSIDTISNASLLSKNEWLTTQSRTTAHYATTDEMAHLRQMRSMNLHMSLFSPQAGREMLEHYASMIDCVRHNQFAKAYKHIAALRGSYPEIDVRVQKADIEAAIQRYGSLGLVTLAEKSIESLRESVQISKDPRHDIWTGDKFRKIARHTGSIVCAQQAVAAYSQALKTTKYPKVVEQKLSKSQALLDQLQPTDD